MDKDNRERLEAWANSLHEYVRWLVEHEFIWVSQRGTIERSADALVIELPTFLGEIGTFFRGEGDVFAESKTLVEKVGSQGERELLHADGWVTWTKKVVPAVASIVSEHFVFHVRDPQFVDSVHRWLADYFLSWLELLYMQTDDAHEPELVLDRIARAHYCRGRVLAEICGATRETWKQSEVRKRATDKRQSGARENAQRLAVWFEQNKPRFKSLNAAAAAATRELGLNQKTARNNLTLIAKTQGARSR